MNPAETQFEFVTVAPLDDVPPGSRLVFGIGRDWIVLFNVDGEFYALEDRCSHAEVPLSEGGLVGTSIECVKHGSLFDLTTGQPLNPPAVSPVKTYPVRVQDGEIQIGTRKK